MTNDQFPTPTSLYVTASRAIGALEPDTTVRNPDFLARPLLGDPSSIDVDHPVISALNQSYDEAMCDPEVSSIVRRLMVRTRFVDERLVRGISNGATQVAIIGAGLDSRPQRFKSLLESVKVFEVDHPDALRFKRRRLEQTLGTTNNSIFVPFDYRRDSLPGVLNPAGWMGSRKTFFIWEGNTMYLPESAVRATLDFVGAHPAGSRIVFDYVASSAIAAISKLDIESVAAARGPRLERILKMHSKEPWIFGVPDRKEREYLDQFQLDVWETLQTEGPAAVKRFLTRADGSTVGVALAGWFPYFLLDAVVR